MKVRIWLDAIAAAVAATRKPKPRVADVEAEAAKSREARRRVMDIVEEVARERAEMAAEESRRNDHA